MSYENKYLKYKTKYLQLREDLINQGYDVDNIMLAQGKIEKDGSYVREISQGKPVRTVDYLKNMQKNKLFETSIGNAINKLKKCQKGSLDNNQVIYDDDFDKTKTFYNSRCDHIEFIIDKLYYNWQLDPTDNKKVTFYLITQIFKYKELGKELIEPFLLKIDELYMNNLNELKNSKHRRAYLTNILNTIEKKLSDCIIVNNNIFGKTAETRDLLNKVKKIYENKNTAPQKLILPQNEKDIQSLLKKLYLAKNKKQNLEQIKKCISEVGPQVLPPKPSSPPPGAPPAKPNSPPPAKPNSAPPPKPAGAPPPKPASPAPPKPGSVKSYTESKYYTDNYLLTDTPSF